VTTVDEPLELVRRWLSSFNARDEDALLAVAHPEIVEQLGLIASPVRRPGRAVRYGMIATFTTPSRWFENSS